MLSCGQDSRRCAAGGANASLAASFALAPADSLGRTGPAASAGCAPKVTVALTGKEMLNEQIVKELL